MCGTGLSVTCRAAVSSPPTLATSACEASWHVVENKNATYQINPKTRVSAVISGMESFQFELENLLRRISNANFLRVDTGSRKCKQCETPAADSLAITAARHLHF